MTDKELRVSKIRDGTVIDHVTAGQALNVLAILGIDGSGGESVSIGMNVPSDKVGQKDVVKVEGRELSQSEVDVLIIRDFDVVEKNRVERTDTVRGILVCPNHNCITNADEPIRTEFEVLSDGVRCAYCDTIIREGDVAEHIDARGSGETAL